MAQVADQVMDTTPENDPGVSRKPKKGRAGLPISPTGSESVNPDQFESYIKALEPGQWARLNFYVYQLEPAIIKPRPSYIDKPPGPIDREYLLARHGSGKYHMKLNDADGAGTIIKTIVQVEDPERPNKFLSGSMLKFLNVKDDSNRQLVEKLQQEGRLTMDGVVIAPATPESEVASMAQALRDVALKSMENKGGQQVGTQDLAYQKSLGMIADASSESLKLVMERLKTEGKSSDLATIMPLLITLLTKKEPQDNGVLAILTQMLTAAEKRAEQAEERARQDRIDAEKDRQRQHELQLEALKTRTDPMDMIDKVLGIKERLSGDDEPKTKRPGWPGLIEDNMDQLIELGKTAIGVLGARSSSYRPTGQPAAAQHQSTTTSAAPEGAAQQQPQREVLEMPSNQISPDPEICFLYPIFLAKGGDLVNFFKSDPTSGPLVADLVRTMGGAATYERIAQMGVDRILATIKLIPQMEADFAASGSSDMLRTFIEDFIEPPQDDDDDDDDPVIPEAGKPAKRAKKAVPSA